MNHEAQATAAAATLRAAVIAGLKAAGWGVQESKNEWSKALFVTPTQADPVQNYIAEIHIEGNAKRDYDRVTQAKVEAPWQVRKTVKTVAYWADWKRQFVVDPAKVVARVKLIAEALEAKKLQDAQHEVWRRESAAKTEVWMKPVTDFMEAHGLQQGWTNDTHIREVKVGTLKLDGLTAEQMVKILAVLV